MARSLRRRIRIERIFLWLHACCLSARRRTSKIPAQQTCLTLTLLAAAIRLRPYPRFEAGIGQRKVTVVVRQINHLRNSRELVDNRVRPEGFNNGLHGRWVECICEKWSGTHRQKSISFTLRPEQRSYGMPCARSDWINC